MNCQWMNLSAMKMNEDEWSWISMNYKAWHTYRYRFHGPCYPMIFVAGHLNLLPANCWLVWYAVVSKWLLLNQGFIGDLKSVGNLFVCFQIGSSRTMFQRTWNGWMQNQQSCCQIDPWMIHWSSMAEVGWVRWVCWLKCFFGEEGRENKYLMIWYRFIDFGFRHF